MGLNLGSPLTGSRQGCCRPFLALLVERKKKDGQNMESFTNSNSTWPNLRGFYRQTMQLIMLLNTKLLESGNKTGSIATNILVLAVMRFGIGLIPGMTTEAAWTLTSLVYDSVSFLSLTRRNSLISM